MYELKSAPNSDPLPVRIYDTMGLGSGEDDTDINNIITIIDGHVPDKHRVSFY
jgi:hypothetical protein